MAKFQSITHMGKGILEIAVFVTLGLTIMYNSLRIHEIYALSSEITVLQTHVMAISNAQTSADNILSTRLDEIERTLFGDVLAKIEKKEKTPPPNRFELWQKNRDAELRERINRLERWRFQHQEKDDAR